MVVCGIAVEVKVTGKKLVDKDGFAISDSKIESESEKSALFVEVDGQRKMVVPDGPFEHVLYHIFVHISRRKGRSYERP